MSLECGVFEESRFTLCTLIRYYNKSLLLLFVMYSLPLKESAGTKNGAKRGRIKFIRDRNPTNLIMLLRMKYITGD